MYENLTVEAIKNDILGRLSTNIDTREGSFANDMVSTVAYEIWKVYQSFNALIPIAFVDETSGEYIDKRAAEYGITRKPGTKAKVTLVFTGVDSTVIPKGKTFISTDGLQFETDQEVIIKNGTASVTATAMEIGSEYNVEAGTITSQLMSTSGLTSVTNPNAAIGGTDPETDAALLARLNDFRKNTATSGNIAHYRQWALEVNGVGAVKVMPLWNGPGTVKVLIAGHNNRPVDPAIVAACKDHIEANRPIGAEVTVASAVALDINVIAQVVCESETDLTRIESAFKNELEEYLNSIAFTKNEVIYNRIVAILLSINGVADFKSLTVNGGTANIQLGDDQVPVVGTVVISR